MFPKDEHKLFEQSNKIKIKLKGTLSLESRIAVRLPRPKFWGCRDGFSSSSSSSSSSSPDSSLRKIPMFFILFFEAVKTVAGP